MTRTAGTTICWDIVSSVADAKGVDPVELEGRLGDLFDVEALQRTVDCARRADGIDLSVEFELENCNVSVTPHAVEAQRLD